MTQRRVCDAQIVAEQPEGYLGGDRHLRLAIGIHVHGNMDAVDDASLEEGIHKITSEIMRTIDGHFPCRLSAQTVTLLAPRDTESEEERDA